MSKVNEAVETIIRHKANKIKKSTRYDNYIKSVLDDHHIEASKEAVEVFKMGAVDAMIYDVGAALDFTKQKRSVDDEDDVDDWTSWEKRKEMLRKIFPKK